MNTELTKLIRLAQGNRTQNQFALNCGVSSASITRICSGQYAPKPAVLEKLSLHALNGVTYTDLMSAAGYISVENTVVTDNLLTNCDEQGEYVKNLRLLRVQRGITLLQLGHIVGVGEAAISLYETGKRQPNNETLSKLADYFGVSVDYLLGRTTKPYADNLPSNCGELGDFIMYPVIGSIRAGFDGLAEEYPTGECVIITVDMLHGRDKSDFFVLTVKGDSMYPKFLSGDRILVKKCSSVDSGDIAAVLYNSDEATVKKVEYPIRKDEDWLDLVPLNPEYKTKRIQGADLELCRVIGKVEYLVSRKI